MSRHESLARPRGVARSARGPIGRLGADRRHPSPLPFLALVGLATVACAGGGRAGPEARPQPEAPEPSAEIEGREIEVSGRLAPSDAAVRTAERVELTGRETGTMWTFENPPLGYWNETYDFRPEPEWLEHVRLASVRYGEICSASFVSPDGLVMTNHHCARDCAEAVSTGEVDYVEEGFYAARREEELECPDLYLDQLVEIEDVTEVVKGAAPPGAPDTAVVRARQATRDSIEEACEADSDRECQVVSLYAGGQFQLYQYRRYQPVKLAFIPELQAGFFGGDPDNFTYPRYVLDAAFVRAYEADGETPASTPHHFTWDPEGASEGELVFITGNPGSTSRGATVAQLMYEQRYRHPFIVQLLDGQRGVLQAIASRGPRAERAVRDQLFSVENSLKAFRGQLGGLRDTTLIGRKIRWERRFQEQVTADDSLAGEYGDVWDRLAGIQADKMRISPRLNAADFAFVGSPHLQVAGTLVRWIREMEKPEEKRLEPYRGGALQETEARLRGPFQADPEVAERLLALRFEIADRWLGPDDPLRDLAFRAGETPSEAARRLIGESRIADPAFRERLMEASPDTLARIDDPLLRLAAVMDTAHRRLQAEWEEVTAAEEVQESRLADALFAVFGTDLPPDATFTLRISDGVVRRYPYNGTFAPPHTSFYGLYERAANFGGEMPWRLPETFAERRNDLDMAVPLNFVTTNDITGGNSGSPMIDREGRVVGLAFDGNIEQLPNEFLFRTEAARTIGVHSAGILEALRSVYEAAALVEELLGSGPAGTSPESGAASSARPEPTAGPEPSDGSELSDGPEPSDGSGTP